jgi:hypothetical protein
MCNEDIYPGELPVGLSTLLSRGPIHFRPPIAGPVLSPHLRAPLPSPHIVLLFQATWAPSNRTNQRAVKRPPIPVDRRGAQHVPGMRPPSTFGRILRPGSSSLHLHVPDPKLLL